MQCEEMTQGTGAVQCEEMTQGTGAVQFEKMTQEEVYWEWLCCAPGLYRKQKAILLKCFKTPAGIWEASVEELERVREHGCTWIDAFADYRRRVSPEEAVHKNRDRRIKFISRAHTSYPKRLRTVEDHPYGLFYRGSLPEEEVRAVAIVGSRVCTHYGKVLAERLAAEIAEAGGIVISGAAYGVDGTAQWAALEHGGKSYAVVGGGADHIYPREHTALFERLEQEGGILSEFSPGTRPVRMHFPMRNRIISGLSDVVAVVEARHRSGSLITADFALEQGRTVMAVPGRIDDELSRGCNELIAQGAGVILSPESFAAEIFPGIREQKKKRVSNIPLAPSEKLVYSSLGLHSKSLWELAECTSLTLTELSEALLVLEQKGLAWEAERNYYVKMK